MALPGPEDATWGNRALTLAYRGAVGDVTLDVAASASDYRAELPLRPTSDSTDPPDTSEGLLASAETSRLRLTLDASAPFGGSRVRFGGAVDRVSTRYSARRFEDLGLEPTDAKEANGVVAGAYLDGVRPLAPGLDLRLGVRADAFSTEGSVHLAPRVAFLWSLSADGAAHCGSGPVSSIYPCLGSAGGAGGLGWGSGECDRSAAFDRRGGPRGALAGSEARPRRASGHRGLLEGLFGARNGR